MNPKIDFIIQGSEISYLSQLLGLKDERRKLIIDAAVNLKAVKKNWLANEAFTDSIIKKMYGNKSGNERITVSVMPRSFYVGAVNIEEKIILFGQPQRTSDFPTAIILHEICHILQRTLASVQPPIVEEIICLLAEGQIYSREKTSLAEVWPMEELDNFHAKALTAALACKTIFESSLTNRSFQKFISYLCSSLDEKTLRTTPPVGVLKNIIQTRKRVKKYHQI